MLHNCIPVVGIIALSLLQIRHATGQVFGCDFSTCVNAAGPWAGEIAKMAGIGEGEDDLSIPLPVEPR